MNNDMKEVGKVQDLEIKDLALRFHREGEDWEKAEIINELQEQGLTQEEIGEKLDLPRYEISRYKRLLDLIPALFEALKRGEIARSTGYELSKLDESKQREYAERVEKVRELKQQLEEIDEDEQREKVREKIRKNRVTHEEVQKRRKQEAISDELFDAIEDSPDVGNEEEKCARLHDGYVICPECGERIEIEKEATA